MNYGLIGRRGGKRSAKSVRSTCIVGELSTVEWLHSGRYLEKTSDIVSRSSGK